MTACNVTEPVLTKIQGSQIDPNEWNPNRMIAEEFQEYVGEVRRLGRVPKPIVVRKKGDRYEILDGEHGWLAAKEVGLSEVLCEVVEADEFIARLETLKRNQHGTHNRVLEGRVFAQMMEIEGINKVGLAERTGVSEGTIRNSMLYAEAADQRNKYFRETGTAPPHCWKAEDDGTTACYIVGTDIRIDRNCYDDVWGAADISRCSVREVRAYMALPEPIGDRWLDAGGLLNTLEPYAKDGLTCMGIDLMPIVTRGFDDVINGKGFSSFSGSLAYAISLVAWIDGHNVLRDAADYVRAVADCGLHVSFLNLLPCRRDGEGVVALVTPTEWAEVLRDARERARDDEGLCALIATGIRVALKDKGVDLSKVLGPRVAEMLQTLEEAPEFLREADYLTLDEKIGLLQLNVDAPEEVVLEAKRLTVEQLRSQRIRGQNASDCGDGTYDGSLVAEVFLGVIDVIQKQNILAAEDGLFADRGRLIERLGAAVGALAGLPDSEIGGLPAVDVLHQRLQDLAEPEFRFVASLMCSRFPEETAGRRWLEAVRQDEELQPS